jgi:hypothetical protein
MVIDPKVEGPARKLLGHAIRGEREELAPLIHATGNEVYPHILTAYGFASAYIAIDVCQRPPTEADLRELSRLTATAVTRLPITDSEIYEFLSRVVLGGEFVDDVFAMERAAVVPLFTAANLLIKFGPIEKEWWEYLDQIWDAYEAAGKTSAAVLPALTYLVHLNGGTRKKPTGQQSAR